MTLFQLVKAVLKLKDLQQHYLLKILLILNGITWFVCHLFSTLAKGNLSYMFLVLEREKQKSVFLVVNYSFNLLLDYLEEHCLVVNLFGFVMLIVLTVKCLVVHY